MNITNGVVEFERSVTPAQYEKKAAKVTLAFTVDEGEEVAAIMARVADVAHAEVFALLRKSEATSPEKYVSDNVFSGTRPPINIPRPVMTPPAPVVQEVPQANPPVSSPAGNASSPPGYPVTGTTVAAPVEITDAELTTICQRTTARMAGPEATKAVIAQFVEQPGMPVRTIPQEKRPAFVAALEALKRDEKVADY